MLLFLFLYLFFVVSDAEKRAWLVGVVKMAYAGDVLAAKLAELFRPRSAVNLLFCFKQDWSYLKDSLDEHAGFLTVTLINTLVSFVQGPSEDSALARRK